MTTIATHPHHRKAPLAAGLAIAGALAVGGILGVAWEANHDTPTVQNVPAVQPFVVQPHVDHRGAAAYGGVDGNTAPLAPTAPTTYGGRPQIGE